MQALWPKGILSDEYGVTPDQCRWIVGGLDWPLKPINFIPHLHPANVEVTSAPEGSDLGSMLEAGRNSLGTLNGRCVCEKVHIDPTHEDFFTRHLSFDYPNFRSHE